MFGPNKHYSTYIYLSKRHKKKTQGDSVDVRNK